MTAKMNASSCLKALFLLHQIHCVVSQEPSANPSLRPSLSLKPSVSANPSQGPTVSSVPTLSFVPSLSLNPSQEPSLSFKPSVSLMPSNQYGISKGSCYLGAPSRLVLCDLTDAECEEQGEYWYAPGYIGGTGCCHCAASCTVLNDAEDTCRYYDIGIIESPTVAPIGEVEEVEESVCFSSHAIARVLGKGRTAMKDLVPGDKVLTASGEHKTMYSMDHFHRTKETVFLRLHTNLETERPLELTKNHMVFVETAKNHPVPAASINVGDKIWSADDGLKEVVKIETVVRNGLYNPLTMDGTIVVDGIVASTYTSYTGSSHVKIAEKNVMSFHELMDMAAAPYRNLCVGISLSLCNSHEKLSVAGTLIRAFFNFWAKQGNTVQHVFAFLYIGLFGALAVLMSLKSYAAVNTVVVFFASKAGGLVLKKKN